VIRKVWTGSRGGSIGPALQEHAAARGKIDLANETETSWIGATGQREISISGRRHSVFDGAIGEPLSRIAAKLEKRVLPLAAADVGNPASKSEIGNRKSELSKLGYLVCHKH